MKMRNTQIILLMIFCLSFQACEKQDQVESPKDQILGKWEIEKLGNGSDLSKIENPVSYTEYLPNNVMKLHSYEEQKSYIYKYWIVDSILVHEKQKYSELENDTVVITERYKFNFNSDNELKLNFQRPAMNSTSIWKKIN